MCVTLFLGLAGAWPMAGVATEVARHKPDYDYYLTGSADDASASPAPTSPSSVLMGGGWDVRRAFEWMIQRAGGGDFVVLRATGDNGYNHYIYNMGGLNSVETLVVKTRQGASDPFVLDRLSRAEAVFIAGGDQRDYITLWNHTPLEALLKQLKARNVPIGGTSAGNAVLGRFDFSAMYGTLYSAKALANPYGHRETLERGFLTVDELAGTLTDDHFVTRDRMGRLMSLVARLVQDDWATADRVRGVAMDEHAALLVADGKASLVGTGAAYLLRPTVAPAVCQARQPLTFRDVTVHKMTAGAVFDLEHWVALDDRTSSYKLSAEAGVLSSTQAGGAIY